MVNVLGFYSDDLSLNPDKIFNFSVNLLLKRTKISKKRPVLANFKNTLHFLFGYNKQCHIIQYRVLLVMTVTCSVNIQPLFQQR